MAALTQVANRPASLCSDWPMTSIASRQRSDRQPVSLPNLDGRLIEPLEWRNAARLSRRFAETLARSR